MGWDAAEEINILNRRLKKEKNPETRDRIRGIILLKKGHRLQEIANIMGVNRRTVYNWRKRYEEEGIEGLKTREKPGRKRKLSDEDMDKLKDLLKQKEYWTTREVRDLIKIEFGIEYTLRHITRILRKLGMKYQKPYVNDYRRPENAEEILKKD